MRASNPAPAITAKCSPLTEPVSITRRCPCRPTRTAAPTPSDGTPRFVASKLAVPAGRIATTAPVPATASMQRWTVPSPPQTNIRSAPSATARRARLGALRLLGTSYQSGSVTPSCASTRRSSGRPPPKLLRACATTAIFVIGSDPVPAGLTEPVDAEDHEADRRREQQRRTEGLVAQCEQGLVYAARLPGAVRDRGVDDQDAGEPEDHAPGGRPDRAEPRDDAARPPAHLRRPQVLQELAADALADQNRADDDDDQADDPDQPPSA